MSSPAKMRSVEVFVRGAIYPVHMTIRAYGAYDAAHALVREHIVLQISATDADGRELEFIAQPTAWRITAAVPSAEPLYPSKPKPKSKQPRRKKP